MQDGNALGDASEELRADREVVMAAVMQDGSALGHASEELRADREVVMAAVMQDSEALYYASEELRADREIVKAAVEQFMSTVRDVDLLRSSDFAYEKLRGMVFTLPDRASVMLQVQSGNPMAIPMLLGLCTPDLCADRALMMAAVKSHVYALEYASPELRADRDLVLSAYLQQLKSTPPLSYPKNRRASLPEAAPCVTSLAEPSLFADVEFVTQAVQLHLQHEGRAPYVEHPLQHIKGQLSDSRLVLAMVLQDGSSLSYASEELQADRDIVMAAVQQNGFALSHASGELQADRDIVMAAVMHDRYETCRSWHALFYASEELQADREVVMAAVQQNGRALSDASKELKADRDIVMAAVQQKGGALYHASTELKADRDIVMAAVVQDGDAVFHASEKVLKANGEIVAAAVRQKCGAVRQNSIAHIGNHLRELARNFAPEALRTAADTSVALSEPVAKRPRTAMSSSVSRGSPSVSSSSSLGGISVAPTDIITVLPTSKTLELAAKLLALRQYIEMLEMSTKLAFKKARETWKVPLVRSRIVPNLLECFGTLHHHALIWRRTRVTFIGEEGIDEGGLTTDMPSSFWHEVLQPQHGLFEQLSDDGGYLPVADANPELLRCVGRVLLKSILDDHPIGVGFGAFIFEYLSGAHEARAFDCAHPQYALQLLASSDRQLALSWASLLDASDVSSMGLTSENFDDRLPDEPLTADNAAAAIVAGCRRLLLDDRCDALCALRDGFTLGGKVDLSLQLAQHRNADLSLLLQGKARLSTEEIIACFDWSESRSAPAVEFLRELLQDESVWTESRRLLLLRWSTGRNALPVSGLPKPVTFVLDDTAGAPDDRLPTAHTCSSEIDLPPYSSKAILRAKLDCALDSFANDASFSQD